MSKVCTKYISWVFSKYSIGVLKSQSINIKECFVSNVSKIFPAFSIPSFSSGKDV